MKTLIVMTHLVLICFTGIIRNLMITLKFTGIRIFLITG